jgi:hypothetical protein
MKDVTSFVVLVGQGYGGGAKPAVEVFDLLVSASEPPPFEVEVLVVSGPGIAGSVLLLYVEDGFRGAPVSMGQFNFDSVLVDGWMGKSCDLSGYKYDFEYYGPRSHALEGYWPGINVAKRRRLAPK